MKKNDAKTFEWHDVHDVFTSPSSLNKKLQETFGDRLPTADEFQIGYIAKRGKRWIEEEADLTSMYKHFKHSGTITLFCEGHSKSKSRKRKASNYTDHEEDIDKLSLELKEKHGDKYNEQQLRLGLHDCQQSA